MKRPPIYAEFVEHLQALGFSYKADTAEWLRGNERGRIAWSCWEDEAWLHKPGMRGEKHYTLRNPAHRITREEMMAGGSGR